MTKNAFKRHLITAALPYANGALHIGHLAGCYIPADTYARFLRANNKDVKFVCASDEHGVPITIRSLKENKTPQEVIDFFHKQLEATFKNFGISFDIYSRTSNEVHHKTSQDFFTTLHEKGSFIEKDTENFFDTERGIFLADRYIKGTCPKCDNPNAYGDQCEKCGSSLSPEELKTPKSTISNTPPIKKITKHWYLDLSKYESWLREWFDNNNSFWKKNVMGQCISWLDGGLKPRAMTRDSEWGVKVPLQNAEGKVLYVWFDAPIGYISATKELTQNWEQYWCSEDSELIHFIGKDNIIFHCIIFPSMLKEHGKFILPKNVPANEFLNLEGNKISTSRDYAVWVDDYIKEFPNNIDSMRYVLTANMPETKDNDFTWKDFQHRNNNELVAIYSNFIYRTCVLLHKLCQGKIPSFDHNIETIEDKEFIHSIVNIKEKISDNLLKFRFRDALSTLMDLAREGNKYMQIKEPWILAKNISEINNTQQKIDNCLYLCIQAVANLAIYSSPFLPETSNKICYQLKVVPKMLEWVNGGNINILKKGYGIRPPKMIFTPIEDDIIKQQVEKLKEKLSLPNINQKTPSQPKENNNKEEGKNNVVTFDDFSKLDIRICTIVSAEEVENTDKLIKMIVDLGNEKRTVVSGIKQSYSVSELKGKQVCLLTNLEKKEIRGIESEGMLLLSEDNNKKLTFISPEININNGAKVS